MLQDGLPRTEWTRDEACSPFDNGIHRVDHTHPRLEQLVRTRLVAVASDWTLDGPLLSHRDGVVYASFVDQDCDGILCGVSTCRLEALDGVNPFEGEGNHDLDVLEVLFYLTEPSTSGDTVTDGSQGLEVPESFTLQWISIRSSLEEDAIHFVEVILQAIVVLREHTRPQSYFEHVSFEGDGVSDTHTAR